MNVIERLGAWAVMRVREMGRIYPELTAKPDYLHEVTETEERRFLETIEGGLRRLEEIFASGTRTIAGDEAFRLYDTFGFPIDLTQIIAGERGVTVDLAGFEQASHTATSTSVEEPSCRPPFPTNAIAASAPATVTQIAAPTSQRMRRTATATGQSVDRGIT